MEATEFDDHQDGGGCHFAKAVETFDLTTSQPSLDVDFTSPDEHLRIRVEGQITPASPDFAPVTGSVRSDRPDRVGCYGQFLDLPLPAALLRSTVCLGRRVRWRRPSRRTHTLAIRLFRSCF